MANYIFAFHGGKMADTPEEQQKVMANWMAWMEGLGSAMVNPGAPCGMSKTVTATGAADGGGANPISGFTLVQADDLDGAVALTKGCPIFEAGGSVEVAEAMEM